MGIQQKIIIPFALLIIAVAAITGVLAIHLNTAHVLRQAKDEENRKRMCDEMKRVKKILGMNIALSEHLLERITPLFEGKIVLTDSSNKPAVSTFTRGELEKVRPILRPADADEPEITRSSADGNDFFVVMDKLPKGGGNIYLVFEAEKIERSPEKPITAVIIVTVAALFLVFGVGLLIARTITLPIKKLAARTGEIARGELDRPINIKGGGEISALSDAFNKMLSGLKAYQEKLVTSEKMAALGQISAGIAHEIRNPLNSISMNVQVMEKEGRLDREALGIINDEIQRLKMVIDELLDFARSPASSPAPCIIKDLVDEVLGLMRRQMEHCGVSVMKDYQDSTEVLVDINRIKQVIMNILLNAVQAMPSGGTVHVRIEPCLLLGGGKGVRCGISDTGHGIAEENAEKIFQPFFSTREGGAGLGLAICKRIIEEAGGVLGFFSSEEGATFRFDIPARAAENS